MSGLAINSVLVVDNVDKVCSEVLKKNGIAVTEIVKKLTKEELLQEIKKHDALIVRSATKVTAEVLAAAPNLKLVGRAGTGTDNVDLNAATRGGVIVMNTPGGNTLSAAEHTCTLILSMGRFVPQACASLKAGSWDRKAYLGSELYGKTLAIIGLGRIGREVAKRLQSFGMTTIGYDPFVSAEAAEKWNIEALELEQIWPRADYITVHTPLLPHTRNLLGEEVLSKKCKRGVKVVNVARGGIIDEVALLKALESGQCGGAALDVFLEEPPTDFTLVRHPKVICTPHLGANTEEAQQRVAQEIAEQIVAGKAGKPLQGLVNAEALQAFGSDAVKPWMELAGALGRLAAVLGGVTASVGHCSVAVQSQGVTLVPVSVETCVLQGVLGASASHANLVNARLLAEDEGIVVKKFSSAVEPPVLPASVQQSLSVSLETPSGTTAVLTGTVRNGELLLYVLNDCLFESGLPLARTLLLYRAVPSAVTASLLPAIATEVASASYELLGLTASSKSRTQVWFVGRAAEQAKGLPKSLPSAQFVGKVSF